MLESWARATRLVSVIMAVILLVAALIMMNLYAIAITLLLLAIVAGTATIVSGYLVAALLQGFAVLIRVSARR